MTEELTSQSAQEGGGPWSLQAVLACPRCHGALADGAELSCTACGTHFPYVVAADRRRVPCFRPSTPDVSADSAARLPWLLGTATSPDHDTFLSKLRRVIGAGCIPRAKQWKRKRQKLLAVRGDATRVLEVGAGGRRLTPQTVTMDIFPLANTDFVANASSLPVRDCSFDCVWLECVLEHCLDPGRVAAEAWRVTAEGGAVFVHVPWMLFLHDFPGDYWRFSLEGLRALFPPEAEVETGVGYGPASAMVSLLAELWARLFTNRDSLWPYAALRLLALLFLVPWKYLDLLLVRTPAASRLASTFYLIARKTVAPGQA